MRMIRQDKTHYIDYRILQDTTKQSKKKLTNVDQCNMIMDLWSSSMKKKKKVRRGKVPRVLKWVMDCDYLPHHLCHH